jgi:hypothetical protein
VAATVFQDRLAATIFDNDHSDDEERWVTSEGRQLAIT